MPVIGVFRISVRFYANRFVLSAMNEKQAERSINRNNNVYNLALPLAACMLVCILKSAFEIQTIKTAPRIDFIVLNV